MTMTTLTRPSVLVSVALCSAALALGGCNKRTDDATTTPSTTPGATTPSTGATPGTPMASSPGMGGSGMDAASSPSMGTSPASAARP